MAEVEGGGACVPLAPDATRAVQAYVSAARERSGLDLSVEEAVHVLLDFALTAIAEEERP